MTLEWQDVVKILLALVVGGVLGAERESRDKAAGFRTMILISVGAAIYTMLSLKLAGPGDPTRIAANIVSGVGFLGAGAILRDRRQVLGLTTAATIWVVAALGAAVGGGQFMLSVVGTVCTLLVLLVFPRIEHWIDGQQDLRAYHVVLCSADETGCAKLEALLNQSGLVISNRLLSMSQGELTGTWEAVGMPAAHDRAVRQLCNSEIVREFQV